MAILTLRKIKSEMIDTSNILKEVDKRIEDNTLNTSDNLEDLRMTVEDHTSKMASTTEQGHVKVDGETIIIDGNGVISSAGRGVSDQEIYMATSSDGLNYSVTMPNVTELYDGLTIRLRVDRANTGLTSLNVNNLGNKQLRTHPSVQSVANDFRVSQVYRVVYSTGMGIFTVEGLVTPLINSYTSISQTNAPTARALNDVYNMISGSPTSVTVTKMNNWNGNIIAIKDGQGMVTLCIDIYGGSTAKGVSICNLPVGYRPIDLLTVPAITSPSGMASIANCALAIYSDGYIYIQGVSVQHNMFANITFRTK